MLQKLVIVLALALLTTQPMANAQQEDALKNYQEYVQKLMDKAKELRQKHPDWTEDKILREARNFATPGALTIDTEGELTPGAKLIWAKNLIEISNSIEQLTIKLDPVLAIKIEVSEDNKTRLAVDAFADPKNASRAELLAKGFRIHREGTKAILSSTINSNYCESERINGNLRGKGSCIYQVTIALPKGSQLLVLNRENKRLTQLDRALSGDDLIETINAASTFEKLKTLKETLQRQSKLKVSADELVKIVNIVGTFDKVEATTVLGARVTTISASQIQNLLSLVTFDSDKLKIIRAIAAKVPKDQLESVARVIESSFNFSSDKGDALSALLRAQK